MREDNKYYYDSTPGNRWKNAHGLVLEIVSDTDCVILAKCIENPYKPTNSIWYPNKIAQIDNIWSKCDWTYLGNFAKDSNFETLYNLLNS